MSGLSETENYRRELAFIVFKHWLIILITVNLVFGGAVAVSLLWPPSWGAHASVLVKGRKIQKDPGLLEGIEPRSMPVTDTDLYSELAILSSNQVFRLAFDRLQAQQKGGTLALLGETPREQVASMQGSLTARVAPATRVIEVQVAASEQSAALEILEAVLVAYRQYRLDIYNPKGVAAFLVAEVERARQALDAKNQEMAEFLAGSGLTLVDDQISANLVARGHLLSNLLTLETAAAELTRDIARLEQLLANRHVQMFYTPVPGLTGAISRDQIADHVAQLKDKLGSTQDGMRRIERRMDQLAQTNTALRGSELRYQAMQREAEVLQRSYQTLLTRRTEAEIGARPEDRALDNDIAVIVPPTLLGVPLFPNKMKVLPAGLAAALLLAISLAFLREYLDHTFSRPQDVQRVLGLPTLFTVPKQPPPVVAQAERQRPRLVLRPRPMLLLALTGAIGFGGWMFRDGWSDLYQAVNMPAGGIPAMERLIQRLGGPVQR